MRYRSRANPRVTIEAMRMDARKETEDAMAALLGSHIILCSTDEPKLLSVFDEAHDEELLRIELGQWLIVDRHGFIGHRWHEEFEAEWEPIDEG
jgi:hypothetical protein